MNQSYIDVKELRHPIIEESDDEYIKWCLYWKKYDNNDIGGHGMFIGCILLVNPV